MSKQQGKLEYVIGNSGRSMCMDNFVTDTSEYLSVIGNRLYKLRHVNNDENTPEGAEKRVLQIMLLIATELSALQRRK